MDRNKKFVKKTFIKTYVVDRQWAKNRGGVTCLIASYLIQWQHRAEGGRYVVNDLPCFISSIPLIAGETGSSLRKTRDLLRELEELKILTRTQEGSRVYFHIKTKELEGFLCN